MTTTTTMSTFERLNRTYIKPDMEAVTRKYTQNFYTMPLDELKTAYRHATYRQHFVSNADYYKMLPRINAMYRALKTRGVSREEISKLYQ